MEFKIKPEVVEGAEAFVEKNGMPAVALLAKQFMKEGSLAALANELALSIVLAPTDKGQAIILQVVEDLIRAASQAIAMSMEFVRIDAAREWYGEVENARDVLERHAESFPELADELEQAIRTAFRSQVAVLHERMFELDVLTSEKENLDG